MKKLLKVPKNLNSSISWLNGYFRRSIDDVNRIPNDVWKQLGLTSGLSTMYDKILSFARGGKSVNNS